MHSTSTTCVLIILSICVLLQPSCARPGQDMQSADIDVKTVHTVFKRDVDLGEHTGTIHEATEQKTWRKCFNSRCICYVGNRMHFCWSLICSIKLYSFVNCCQSSTQNSMNFKQPDPESSYSSPCFCLVTQIGKIHAREPLKQLYKNK